MGSDALQDGYYERLLVAGLLQRPALVSQMTALAVESFGDVRLGTVFGAVRRLVEADPEADWLEVVQELDAAGELEPVGGPHFVAEIFDEAPTAWDPRRIADRVLIGAKKREVRRIHLLAADRRATAAELDRIPELESEVLRLEYGEELDPDDFGFSGAALDAFDTRPALESPLVGFFDEYPGLHIIAGKPKSGKTTFALSLAQAWACGDPPWEGASPIPRGSVLVLSREQYAMRINVTLRRMDVGMLRKRSAWRERTRIVARDQDLSRRARRLLTLDLEGISLLGELLRAQRQRGAPYSLVILDSLSRLKPPGLDENEEKDLTPWLDQLNDLAAESKSWFLLIHHAKKGEQDDPVEAARGSGAIAAVPQSIWLMSRDDQAPRQRRVRTEGNITGTDLTFEVCHPADENEKHINYWKPLEVALRGKSPEEYLSADEEISQTELAFRLEGGDRGSKSHPLRSSQREASRLASQWEASRQIVRGKGSRNTKTLRLRMPGETA